MSRTERNLNALREKRRQLEGPIDGVQRLTEVLLPRDGASVPPLQKFAQDEGFLFSEKDTSMTDRSMVIDEEVVDDDREALSLLSKSLMSTMRRAKQMEDAPLITSAMRELQQLEKDRIYTRVLVRVRFPDTVSLQGYFHPRHTIFDVYQWVVESFTAEYRNACTVELSRQKPLPQSTRGIKTARTGSESLANFFELYTSPPRRVLASDGVASLHDLNFTPAVVINLAWLIDFDLISTALENPQPAGFYLFPQLLKDSAESDTSAAFPVGQDLTMKPSAMSGSSSLGVNSKTSATSSSSAMDSSEKPSVAKVPKWFKIGR